MIATTRPYDRRKSRLEVGPSQREEAMAASIVRLFVITAVAVLLPLGPSVAGTLLYGDFNERIVRAQYRPGVLSEFPYQEATPSAGARPTLGYLFNFNISSARANWVRDSSPGQ